MKLSEQCWGVEIVVKHISVFAAQVHQTMVTAEGLHHEISPLQQGTGLKDEG